MSPFTKSKQSVHLLELYEDAHGIPRGTLAKLGWRECTRRNRPAISFPVGHARRWRFMDDQTPKYDQNPDYHPAWFGLKRSVANARRWNLDYIVDCNGAASTVAADCHHIPAFSLQSGESTTPQPELVTELKEAWQGTVYVTFDCDADGEGHRAAVKRVQTYRKAGLAAEALDLALAIDGGDLADFCKANAEQSPQRLLDCPRLPIPDATEPKRAPYIPKDRTEADQIALARLAIDALATWRRDTYYAWVEVGMALTELGEAGLDLWEHWSQGYEKYKPGECAKKWKSFKKQGLTLAALFYFADTDYGPTWRPYKPPALHADGNLTPTNSLPPAPYPISLPIAVRGALNAYAHPSVAPILELWLEGLKIGALEPGEAATVECLAHISKLTHRGLSIHTIRTGLKHCTDPHGVIFLRVLLHDLNTNTDLISGPESRSSKTLRNANPCKRKGRFPEVYMLLPWNEILANLTKLAIAPILQKAFPADSETVAPIRAEFLADLGQPDAERLAAALNDKYGAILAAQPGYRQAMDKARREYKRLLWALSNPQTAPIPADWTYRNASEYGACCARAIVEAAGGVTQYSRKRLCELIGCSDRNLKAVLNRAGIWIAKEGTTTDVPMKTMAQVRAIKGYNYEAKGYPVSVVSSAKDAPFPFEKRGVLAWAEAELRAGAKVSVRFQQAHRQLVDTLEQPKKHGPRLVYAALVFLRALIDWLMRVLAREPEDETPERPERSFREARPLSAWVRLHVQLRLLVLFEWLSRNYRPKPRKERYTETWLRNLTTRVTDWQAEPDRLVDRSTGEVADFSIQLTLDKLLESPCTT